MSNSKEIISPEKIIMNILNCYDLKVIEDKKLKGELSKEILKDLSNAGYLK